MMAHPTPRSGLQPNGLGAPLRGAVAPVLPARPRILVVTLRRIGDALLTTPLVRSIRRAWPDATLDILVYASNAGIFEGNPDIDRIIGLPTRPSLGESLKLMARLYKRYDLAVSTQSGDRPTLFALTAGRTHVGLTVDESYIVGTLKRYLLHRSVPFDDSVHRVEEMLRMADTLGIERVAEVVCPAAAPADDIAPSTAYALLHAAPMQRYRQWTAAGWRALAAALQQRGLAVVATAGPGEDERNYLNDIWQGVLEPLQTAWPQTVSLLSKASVYVGTNTSVSHLAAATGCPTVVLFGALDARVWGPWPVGGLASPWASTARMQNRGNVWVVQHPLPCLPCRLEGCERHIDSYSRCLDELTPEQVLAAVDQALTVSKPHKSRLEVAAMPEGFNQH